MTKSILPLEHLQNLHMFSHPNVGCAYDENVWSCRLKYTIEYTASGGHSFASMQYECSNLGPEHIGVYPFRGVPYICIQKSIYVSAQPTEEGNEHDDSLESSIFENTRQTSVHAVVPPKFGQLFASLHCFLVQSVKKSFVWGYSST